MKPIPKDLNTLVRVPDEHIKDNRHSMAKCKTDGCRNPVVYKMVIEEWPFNDGNYNTDYFCEEHCPWMLR